jgi:dihydrofolate reductase
MSAQSIHSSSFTTSVAALRSNLRFHGLAVVSSDGLIGRTHNDITFDWSSGSDKEHFFCTLDRASLCIMGRKTHELYPNKGNRSRLVISRSVPDGERDPCDPQAMFCNIDTLTPSELLQRISLLVGTKTDKLVCVLGGSQIYKLFLEHPCLGFDSFDVTVEENVAHHTGVALFPEAVSRGLDGLLQTFSRAGLQIHRRNSLTPGTTLVTLQASGDITTCQESRELLNSVEAR